MNEQKFLQKGKEIEIFLLSGACLSGRVAYQNEDVIFVTSKDKQGNDRTTMVYKHCIASVV